MKPFTVFVVNFYEPDDLNYLTITEGVDMMAAQNAAVTLCAEAWNCSKKDLEVWLVLEGHHYDLLQTSADVSPSETFPADILTSYVMSRFASMDSYHAALAVCDEAFFTKSKADAEYLEAKRVKDACMDIYYAECKAKGIEP